MGPVVAAAESGTLRRAWSELLWERLDGLWRAEVIFRIVLMMHIRSWLQANLLPQHSYFRLESGVLPD